MTDVGHYPFRQAAHYTPGRRKPIRLVVLHDMETGEGSKTAETVAAVFADPNSRKASAHFCVDNDSIIRCVHDADTAWHAAGANSDGIGIEHAGRANQTRAQWLDPFGKQMLERSAYLTALLCKTYGIPPVHLTVAQVADGRTKGLCGHRDVSAAFPNVSTGHSDPGPNFPWDYYTSRVKAYLKPATTTPQPVRTTVRRLVRAWRSNPYPRPTRLLVPGSTGRDVRWVQWELGIKADGDYGPITFRAVKGFQAAWNAAHPTQRLVVDGKVGRNTLAAMVKAGQ